MAVGNLQIFSSSVPQFFSWPPRVLFLLIIQDLTVLHHSAKTILAVWKKTIIPHIKGIPKVLWGQKYSKLTKNRPNHPYTPNFFFHFQSTPKFWIFKAEYYHNNIWWSQKHLSKKVKLPNFNIFRAKLTQTTHPHTYSH